MFLGNLPGEFRLRIISWKGRPAECEDELANRLFEVGFDDSSFSSSGGVCFLDCPPDRDIHKSIHTLGEHRIRAEFHRYDQSEMIYMTPDLYVRGQNPDDVEADKLWEAHGENYLRMIDNKAPEFVKRFMDQMPCLHDSQLVVVSAAAGCYNLQVKIDVKFGGGEFDIKIAAPMHQNRLIFPPDMVDRAIDLGEILYDEFHLSGEQKDLSWHFFCSDGWEHSFYNIKEILWKKIERKAEPH